MSVIPSNTANSLLAQQLVAIVSVDVPGQTAVGRTRQASNVHIDTRYPVGAVHVTPIVGQQWVLKKVGLNWTLDRQLPKNTNTHANILDDPTPGMVQIGSSGVGQGPLVVDGTKMQVNAPVSLNSATLYQDNNGVLENSIDGGITWRPVVGVIPIGSVGSTGSVGSIGQTGARYIARASLAGDANSINKVFTLSELPALDSEMIFLNGLLQNPGPDYALSGKTVTFAIAPDSGSIVLATYFEAE